MAPPLAHAPSRRPLAALLLLAAASLGCTAAPAQSCREDADCRGLACVNGQCRTVTLPDAAAPIDGANAPDDGAVASSDLAGPPGADLARPLGSDLAGAPGDGPGALCNFNQNGVLERGEAFFLVGLGALYATAAPGATVPVEVKAKNNVWDFAAPVAMERKVFDQLVSPKGSWWERSFPTATHAQRLDDNQPLLGVYRVTADRLDLLGVVSEQGGLTRTELTYQPPVTALKFPLQSGDSWSVSATVSGLAGGVVFAATEKYELSVDGRGTTKVPAGSFDTLRLKLRLTQTVGFLVTKRLTYLHLAECYGAVARVRSRDNEAADDFTQAAEYRRLAVP